MNLNQPIISAKSFHLTLAKSGGIVSTVPFFFKISHHDHKRFILPDSLRHHYRNNKRWKQATDSAYLIWLKCEPVSTGSFIMKRNILTWAPGLGLIIRTTKRHRLNRAYHAVIILLILGYFTDIVFACLLFVIVLLI